MKKLLSLAACLVAVTVVAVSCTPKDKPDGKCELTAFSLSSSIAGTIDAAAKTITVVIPTSVTSDSFTPTFAVTDYDVVTIGGTPATSGETSVTVADGTKVIVADEVSAMTTEYTIVVVETDQVAELTSVVFKAADNSLLDEDVVAASIAPEIIVRVPEEAFRKKLKVTLEAGMDDEIKVNNTVVASGSSIEVDCDFPIDITVTDAVAGKSASYIVKVGKILDYVVTKLGTYAEGEMNDFTMTINPNDNLPYFAYTRKLNEEEKNWNVSLAKWNGSAFELVGSTGIANVADRSASKPEVAFSKDGTIYYKYLGGEVASMPTVKKLDAEWTLVGDAGFTGVNVNTTYYYPFFVHPATGKPAMFWCVGGKKTNPGYRQMHYANFGESWTTNIVTGTVPAYGSGSTSTSGMYYTSFAVENDGKVYIVSSFNEFGYYVHEVNADGTLTPIVENYLPEEALHGLGGNLQMKLGPNGTLYVFAAVRVGDGSMQLYTVDQDAKTLKPYGAASPAITIGASGVISENYGMAVNPVNGLVTFVYDTEQGKGAPAFAYLDDNMQWAAFEVESPAVSKSEFWMQFDKTGENCYVAYMAEDALQLYRIGLEPDILPGE